MIQKRITLLPVLLILCCGFCYTQDIKQSIHNEMEAVRNGKALSFDHSMLAERRNAKQALDVLKEYYHDSVDNVKLAAARLTFQCAYQSDNKRVRHTGVEYLTFLGKSKSQSVGNYALRHLTSFGPDDFSNEAKYILRDLVNKQHNNYQLVLKLTGLANMQEMLPLYKAKLVHDTLLTRDDRWVLHTTMARLGDTTEANYVLLRAKKINMNNDFVYHFMPDLIYTRQKKVFDYLVKQLQSNEKNCTSSHPDYPGQIICGYRIMEAMAPAVKNFPYNVLASGDLDADDYEKALADVREWFKNNPDYEIRKDGY